MILGGGLSILIAAYVLVIPAYLILRSIQWLKLPAAFELRLHYFALGFVFVASLAQPLLPRSSVYEPTVKLWSATSMRTIAKEKSGEIDIGYGTRSAHMNTQNFTAIWWFLAMAVVGFSLARLSRDLSGLRKLIRNGFMIRKIGHVAILVSEDCWVPLSFRGLTKAYVVIPAFMVAKPEDFKIAVAHELQHHRQGDTAWIYMIWFAKAIFVVHPLFYLWNRHLLEIQEFACDETLLDHRKVSSNAYARCLVETAETAFHQTTRPACATGLLFLIERHLISRRIENMFNTNKLKNSRGLGLALTLALGAVLTTTAYATKGIVQDRRVSMKDAQAMLSRAQVSSDFPIVVNDLVLAELNRYIGTEDGRAFMRKALTRLETYRGTVEAKLDQYGLPAELAAIPITESGYQNLEEDGVHGHGAGLWMFIKDTAHKYGMTHTEKGNDDRLIPALETDAAMRYLGSNDLRFNDWLLAIQAYNTGEKAVQAAIDSFGTRDVWTLIRNGLENDHNYLARVMAAILIMKNPDSVK